MCGLTGFIGRPAREDELVGQVEAMAIALRHRGPDAGGRWVDPDAGVALGHRRLSIIDLSAEGHQPMVSPCGRFVLVFNGEIYNFRALRAELEEAGHRWRGHSDTEVLLTAIARWGVRDTLPRLNGMFAFAVWDRQERRLYLARDPLGEKPLYYGMSGGTLLFGSELKALRAHAAFSAEVDPEALGLFFRFGYVPAPRSIYRGIFKLPPGSWLCVDPTRSAGLPAPVTYWSAREVAERGSRERLIGTEAELTDQLEDLLLDAVRLRMEADVPLGAFLSGGIDSSTVVALMQKQSASQVRTFSIAFAEASHNEADHARAVASHLGTDHTELCVTPQEALDVVPRLPYMYDEPFADSSQIPTFLVAELARRSVTVSLSGDGGDEVFGGYNRHLWGQRIGPWLRGTPMPLRRGLSRGLNALSPDAWDSILASVGPVLPKALVHRHPGDKLHKLAGALTARDGRQMYGQLVSLWGGDGASSGGALPAPGGMPAAPWADLGETAEQMMYMDTVQYLPDDILVKVDRATMAVSLEGRIPLLDPRVVEFAWRLPLHFKVRGGVGKYLLRQVLYRHVPREMLERPKAGFAVPVDQWLRGELREWAEELLDERRLRLAGVLEPTEIRKRWSEHLSGRRNWQHHLWAVLMFQAWQEASDRAPLQSAVA